MERSWFLEEETILLREIIRGKMDVVEMTDHSEHVAQILCCTCGTAMPPNPANMCSNCLQNEVDITEGISKELTLFFCRGCLRYLKNPNWIDCQLESRELLALCLKKVCGLQKVKLIDAQFIWTEPHSRRVKVKLTVQSEVLSGVILQQSFIVHYVVKNQQCDECKKSYTENTWSTVVQIRQKAEHKRTFYYLEQLILKHGMTESVAGVKEVPDGLDFYFQTRSHGQHMLQFLQSVIPIRVENSKRLVSQDFSSNVCTYKHNILADISPVCRDDLVCLPKKLLSKLGGCSPLMVCTRVTACLRFTDPESLKTVDVRAGDYFNAQFRPVCNSRQLKEFMIMDVQPMGAPQGKLQLAEVECALMSDLGTNDTTHMCVTHLGNVLRPGDTCLGYDMTAINVSPGDLKSMKGKELPEVVLVRKIYPERHGKRHWRLKQITVEREERYAKKLASRDDHDREIFMQHLEEDPDMRKHINMYKVPGSKVAQNGAGAPTVGVDELLDDMGGMRISQNELKHSAMDSND
eukprot:328033_1